MNQGDTNSGVNAKWLLWAGFTAILAAGVGFGIRGGILTSWGREFGFTASDLGKIGGGGLTGFCFGIVIGGIVADRIGYGKLVFAAFLFHILSAVITFAADPTSAKTANYQFLFWGTFIFAVANGTLEAVANPLVATLFPQNRTHYLNILHASWPAGLILGGMVGWILGERMDWHWKKQLGLFLVPVVIYGLMFFGRKMPRSEASVKGLSLGQMFKDVGVLGGLVICYLLSMFFGSVLGPILAGSPPEVDPANVENSMKLIADHAVSAKSAQDLANYIGYGIGAVLLIAIAVITRCSFGSFLLFVLFVTHGLVGAVELGTDGWIQNITGNILTEEQGKILFVITSAMMFMLRFCAHFIETRLGLSPIGILLVCAVMACLGLNLTSHVNSFGFAVAALLVYALGKTFFWPTMLAVASDRYPRTGAIAISIMGGIGMMSSGLIGSPGLGYCKDRFAAEALQSSNPALMAEYKAEKQSSFLFLPLTDAIDGKKLGAAQEKLNKARKEEPDLTKAYDKLNANEKTVIEASIQGDRMTLRIDSVIPATMAVIYLLILIYFRSTGGYKAATIDEVEKKD